MAKVHVATLPDPRWCYDLIPSQPLPVVNLSQSLKARLLSKSMLPRVERFLIRYYHHLSICHCIALGSAIATPYVNASAAPCVAVMSCLTGLPLGLGGLSNLRFEMVRLLLSEDSVWFFCFTNIATQILISIMYGDLRAFAVVVELLGITNVVLVDAKMHSIRRLTQLGVLGFLSTVSLLVCVFFDRIEQPHATSLWQYKAGAAIYSVGASDYVLSGNSTIAILLAKIIFRKHRALRRSIRQSSTIECAILRCRTRLVLTGSKEYLFEKQNSTTVIVNNMSPIGFISTSHVQRLQHVRSGCIYDARKIVFPAKISSKQAFPQGILAVLYLAGICGFISLFALANGVFYGTHASDNSSSTQYSSASFASFVCSSVFCLAFFACYQHDLYVSLITSFDFVFYSLQVTVAHASAISLAGPSRANCTLLASAWLWTHWIFCLDALTPIMKAKLRFHVRFAFPVLVAFLIGHIALVCIIPFTSLDITDGRDVWSICMHGYTIEMRLLPVLIGRLMILTAWMLRLAVRLHHASNSDTIILRGVVTYTNYQSDVEQTRPRKQTVSNLMTIPRTERRE